MTPEPITIDGRTGTVVYLDNKWHPVTPEQATMARVLFDDGGTAFYITEGQDTIEKYDPSQLRDEKGRWAKGSGHLGTTFLHGTVQGLLDDIIANGLRGSMGGLMHPTDRLNRTLALPGHVYMTTDEREARAYARIAGVSNEDAQKKGITIPKPSIQDVVYEPKGFPLYRSGTEIGGTMPVVLTIELPRNEAAKLRKDRRSDLLMDSTFGGPNPDKKKSEVARSYKGDIKPKWITSIAYMTTDMETGEDTWHTISPKEWKTPQPTEPPPWEKEGKPPPWQQYLKAAADTVTLYIPFAIQLQSTEGLGGITRKFDELQHPRGKDGRFIEATEPRIFKTPSDVESKGQMHGEEYFQWVKEPGHLLTGQPLSRDQIPATLYHVTTAGPAVEESGVLLGQNAGGGLGGGQELGVSFTSSKEDAELIQRELIRSVRVARGEDRKDAIERWARTDEKLAGLPEGSLQPAVDYAMQGWGPNALSLEHTFVWDDKLPDDKRGYVGPPPSPEEHERLYRGLVQDVQRAYLQLRERTAEKVAGKPVEVLKNPLLLGDRKKLMRLDPAHIQILEVAAEDIPAEALVTTGSDKFLHEVRVYADVPRRRKTARDYVREPAGTAEGGQFAEVGDAGQPKSDPVLAVQAKAGIAAVEKLLPEAVKTADFSNMPGSWDDLPKSTREKAYKYYEENTYDEIDIRAIDADLLPDVLWNLRRERAPELAEKAKARLAEHFADRPVDLYSLQRGAKDVDEAAEQNKNLRLDMATVHIPDPRKEAITGHVILDVDALRYTNGMELTAFEKDAVRQTWEQSYQKVLSTEVEQIQDTDEYLAKREAAVLKRVSQRWESMSDQDKALLIPEMISQGAFKDVDNPYGTTGAGAHEPAHWKTGIEEGTHDDEDYARTHVIALKLAELRTDELRKERGLFFSGLDYTISREEGKRYDPITEEVVPYKFLVKNDRGEIVRSSLTHEEAEQLAREWQEYKAEKSSQKLIQHVWQQWKQKSSEGLSLSLQLAAARELGGHHRMTPDEVKGAEESAKAYGGIETLQAYVRAQWETTQFVMAKAGQDKLSVYRGLMLEGEVVKGTTKVYIDKLGQVIPPPSNIQTGKDANTKSPYVSFDFNGQHFVALKEKVPVNDIRDLVEARPWESDESVIQRRLAAYEENEQHRTDPALLAKLSDLSLLRAGAQSTTGTRSVANDWNGVGNLPDKATRVVLRIEAPSTSALSLPVYGQNEQEEHETVLLGTKDKWLWDAWRDRAPDFSSQPVSGSAKKADTIPLVIDLQAEDRGKHHWMSSVNWTVQSIAKWDEAKHPREPGGTAEGGQFASSAKILQGVDSKANTTAQITEFRRVRKFLSGEEPDLTKEKAAEDELRALPLVHGTTVAGAIGAMEQGLLSHADMEGQVKDLKEDIADLHDSIDNIVGEDADWGNIPFWTEDDIEGLGLDRLDAKALRDYVQELQDVEKVIMGTTNPADKKVGLDQFVFMTHGEKHQDYGNVAVIIDNEVIQDSWATEKDIVVVPGGAEFDDTGMRDRYNPRRIEKYQQMIVRGEDYYAVAAARAGSPEALLHRSREQLFEIKAPRVPKSAIKGFLVADDLETAQRLADKLAAKGLKEKVLYVEDPGYNSERKQFVQDQLKAVQRTGMWDDEAIERFKEEHEGVYLL